MADVGRLALTIAANAAPLEKTLAATTTKLVAWAGGIPTILRRAASLGAVGFAAEGLVKVLEKSVVNPLHLVSKGLAAVTEGVSRIPVVGGLLALPFTAAAGAADLFADAIDRSQEQLGALSRISKQTGASVADSQVFSFLAGSVGGMRQDLDAAGPLMVKFQKALALAATQGKETDNAFNRLGLNARELASGDLLGAFGAFADKIKGLNNQAFAGQLSMRVFEEAGLRLLPTLLKGAAGVDEVRKKLDAFGLTVSGGAADSLADLQKRATELRLLREGFFNQLSQAALPILGAISDQLPRITGGFKGLAEPIIEGFFKAADAVAYFIDVVEAGRLKETFEAVGLAFKAAMLDAIGAVIDALPDLAEAIDRKLTGGTGTATAVTSGLRDITGRTAAIGGTGAALREAAADARRQADALYKGIGEQIGDDARSAVAALRESALKRLREPGGREGAGFEATLQAAQQRLFSLQEKFLTPSAGFRRQMDELDELLKTRLRPEGEIQLLLPGEKPGPQALGDLIPGLGGRAAFAMFQQLTAGAGRPAPTQSAAEAGSAEAARIITSFGEVGKLDQQAEIRRVLQETKLIEERQAAIGEQVLQVQRQLADQLKPKGM